MPARSAFPFAILTNLGLMSDPSLGEKGLLEEETKDLYQGAGMIHILSISGIEKEASWICAQGRKPHNYAENPACTAVFTAPFDYTF